jgi:hypothetical protein
MHSPMITPPVGIGVRVRLLKRGKNAGETPALPQHGVRGVLDSAA